MFTSGPNKLDKMTLAWKMLTLFFRDPAGPGYVPRHWQLQCRGRLYCQGGSWGSGSAPPRTNISFLQVLKMEPEGPRVPPSADLLEKMEPARAWDASPPGDATPGMN